MQSSKSRWIERALLIGGALIAAALMTWPLAQVADDHILRAKYYWDAYCNTMIMSGRIDALTGIGPLSPYDNYFFAPLPNSIAFNENHFGLSLLFAPFYLLSKNPLWAYNLTLLLSTALSVVFTYYLVRRITGDRLVGFWVGVAFAFSPYVMFEMGRIQLVATQWIPASFLFLHRAIEDKRKRDIFCFWASAVMQVGTCLYYAMFLVPLLGCLLLVSLIKARPDRSFYAWFCGVGLIAGALVLGMVYPYFSTRDAFDLERSLAFASSYDGRLDFLGNVPETNRTLTALRHASSVRGAHEEIAFMGFVAIGLALLGVAIPVVESWRRTGSRQFVLSLARWFGLFAASALVTLMSRSMLVGLAALILGGIAYGLQLNSRPFSREQGLYWALLLLAFMMFLGLFPFEWRGEKVRGLYYYFHTYFPGFNGIRKVSRQAVMTTFLACVCAGFGGAWLLARFRPGLPRNAVFLGLLGLTCLELRSFPHPIEPVWAGDNVPEMLEFARTLPADEYVASFPQSAGARRFRGDRGMALHDYLAVYHKHRFANGQSSWLPPVTDLVRRALRELPNEAARRALWSAGARHLLIFGDDLPPDQRDLISKLSADKSHFRRVFAQDEHVVFSLINPHDPDLEPLPTPRLPNNSRMLPTSIMRASASLKADTASSAIDGTLETRWSTGRAQSSGQSFEVMLNRPAELVALEIENPEKVMDVPNSFKIEVAQGDGPLRTVSNRPKLRLFHEQIFSPKSFIFREVFGKPAKADRIVITIEQATPSFYFSIYELRLYASGTE